MEKIRQVIAYKNFFEDFLLAQPVKVQDKIYKIIEAIETLREFLRIISNSYKEPKDCMKQEFNWGLTFGEFSAFLTRENWLSCLTDLQKRPRKLREKRLTKHLD